MRNNPIKQLDSSGLNPALVCLTPPERRCAATCFRSRSSRNSIDYATVVEAACFINLTNQDENKHARDARKKAECETGGEIEDMPGAKKRSMMKFLERARIR